MAGSERLPGGTSGDLDGVWEVPQGQTGAPAGTHGFLEDAVIDTGGGALDALLVAYDYD